MRVSFAVFLCLAAAAVRSEASETQVPLKCEAGAIRSSLAIPKWGNSLRLEAPATSAWLRISESGQDVAVSTGGGVSRLELQVPPRYGVTWLEVGPELSVSIARVLPGDAVGEISIALDCDGSSKGAWEHRFAGVAATHVVRSTEPEIGVHRDAIAGAAAEAPDDFSRAWALHVEAQLLLLNERSADSIPAFERAEQAWIAAGDPARASAARVARAEDMQRAGQYEAVLGLAAANAPGADPYFAARLDATSCLALRSLARTAESLACFERVIARFDTLGEGLERASALQDHALLLADLDRLDDSEALARDTLQRLERYDEVPGPGVPTVRGRTHWLLADLALRRGDVAAALRECDAALDAFTIAQHTRWQGNTLLRIAEVYAALGATGDAIAAAEQAQSLFSPRDAPTRVAAAALVRARLQLAQRDYPAAQALAAEAAEVFAARQSATELEAARLVQATARLRGGELIDEQSLPPAGAANALARVLLLVESDLATGALDSAASRLGSLHADALAPPQRLEVDRLRARWHDLRGEHAAADALRWSAATTLVATAQRSGSAVVRDLLLGRLDPIRRDAYAALLLRRDSEAHVAARALQWALIEESSGPIRGKSVAKAARYDSLLARELLPYGSSSVDRVAGEARAASLRSLLSYLVRAGASSGRAIDSTPEHDVRPALAPGDLVVGLVDGGERMAVILADARSTRLVAIGDRVAFRQTLARFSRAALDQATPLAALDADAGRIGSAVFNKGEVPSRIFVLGDGGLDALPWGLVQGPDGKPLVETTNIVLVTRAGTGGASARPGAMDVLVANAAPDELPQLASAPSEARLVGTLLRNSGVSIAPSSTGDRTGILGALSREHGWVHVVAHGVTEPRRLGRSGIWTTPEGKDAGAAFLSWLDPMARGVAADLVVLNACALARGDATGDRSALNFAAAVSRAGARDVVAAMWPISDTASAIWIPAFYGALLEGSPDAAEATRAAQRALRETRRFRHPAHWAGLVHLGELPISS